MVLDAVIEGRFLALSILIGNPTMTSVKTTTKLIVKVGPRILVGMCGSGHVAYGARTGKSPNLSIPTSQAMAAKI
jgi:hypothetical protein